MLKCIRVLISTALLITLTASFTWAKEEAGGMNFGWKPKLTDLVNINNVRLHQKMLQYFADRHDGNRAAGTTGFEASKRYMAFLLKLSNLDVSIQDFEFPYFEELGEPQFDQVAPNSTVYTPNDDNGFRTMKYSDTGNVTGAIQFVDVIVPPADIPNTSTSGCETDDFIGFIPGKIALIQRGSCTFYQKAINAQNAGAIGVIIFNEGQEGRQNSMNSTLASLEHTIPVISTSYAIGEELVNLASGEEVSVHIKTETVAEPRITQNIIASTRAGDPTKTVVIGGHLDSVVAGPGINDNGSGSSAILETAMKTGWFLRNPKHKLIFALWVAEQVGLVGSEYWLDNLSTEEKDNIHLYLNFDMIASPNFVRFVFDGDGSDTPNAGPPGSGAIEQFFVDYFGDVQLATEPTILNGRSDYAPFWFADIPVGGLFTGAGGLKTEEQALVYGGAAGEPYDANYHTPDDNIDNINYEVEEQNLKAMAAAVQYYSENSLPEEAAAVKSIKTLSDDAPKYPELDFLGPYLQK